MDNTNPLIVDPNINPDLVAPQGVAPTLSPTATPTPTIASTTSPIDITPASPTIIPEVTDLTPTGTHLSDLASQTP